MEGCYMPEICYLSIFWWLEVQLVSILWSSQLKVKLAIQIPDIVSSAGLTYLLMKIMFLRKVQHYYKQYHSVQKNLSCMQKIYAARKSNKMILTQTIGEKIPSTKNNQLCTMLSFQNLTFCHYISILH